MADTAEGGAARADRLLVVLRLRTRVVGQTIPGLALMLDREQAGRKAKAELLHHGQVGDGGAGCAPRG